MKKLILTLAAICLTPALSHAEEKKLELTANDQMQYSAKTLEVTAGDKVTVKLTHTGKFPKQAMGHNFVLLKKDVTAQAFATKAVSAAATDYIPQDDASKAEVIAHTKLLGGKDGDDKESDSVTFDAPEPGEYVYLCTFPGHFAAMNGKLVVKAK